MDGLRWDEEAYGNIGEGSEFKGGGIADGEGSRWNGDRGSAAEGEGAGCGRIDFAVAGGEGNVGGADAKWVGAELVREHDANDGTAEGDVDDLAEGSIAASHQQIACGIGAIDGSVG